MPRRSPFSDVPARLAEIARPRLADLHVHTSASDGDYTPAQVVALARQAKLAAVAITDHDTLAAVGAARAATEGGLEVVSGVEISASHTGRELHLLGYFVRPDDGELDAALARVREGRRARFHHFVARLAAAGTRLPDDRVELVAGDAASLGRRHLAKLLVDCGFARSRVEAFHRLLGPVARAVVPKVLLPVGEAIRLVRGAGGVASLAHPPPDLADEDFLALVGAGLAAVEAEYPWGRNSPARRLRATAARLGLAVTGGSDCHGPDPSHRRVGSRGVTAAELTALRDLAVPANSVASRG
jgi:predicted metal-dependent phosphoesterase TrpH